MGAREHPAPPELRELPSVHELAGALEAPHPLAVSAARRAIDERRAEVLAGIASERDLVARASEVLAELEQPSLRRVLNATGVIVHTNLGRAPLAATARAAVARVSEGYSNLELELEGGARGSRQAHICGLLRELTRAEDALVVNNGAAAVLLAAAALAGPGRSIVVSRGQLVEIGGGFRIPEVIAQSGSSLVEVGTTNRTRVRDYERAIAAAADKPLGAILRVHPSNFRSLGFVEEVSIEQLCGLGVAVIDDLGSGVLGDASGIAALSEEPSLRRSLRAGATLVCCSGDKLLGGPQAGLLLGAVGAVAAAREHPLARALRIDKLSLAVLEATLMLYRDPQRARREIPVLAMLDASEAGLAARAERLRSAIGGTCGVIRATGKVGGGALPLLELEGPVVALTGPDVDPAALSAALRAGDPPVIGRIGDGRLLLDPRTLSEDEVPLVAAAARAALERLGRR
jgi:L-seryl-tRNA(Ser) seleniumtransferase